MAKRKPLIQVHFELLQELSGRQVFPPDHFKGRGNFLKLLIQRGYAEWLRENEPKSNNATGIRITELGLALLPSTPNREDAGT
jgi:hypothetical protein